MSGRRIDLSATQVVASMLAAITGAVAASTLGVAGTVIGTAVMSVASTAVAAVYKHYIARSKERLRAAAESARIPPLVGDGAAAAIRRLQRATQTTPQPSQTTAKLTSHRSAAGSEADKTEVFPAVGFSEHRWHDADRANGFAHHPRGPADDATEIISGAAARRAAAESGDGGTTQAGGGATEAGRAGAAESGGGSGGQAGSAAETGSAGQAGSAAEAGSAGQAGSTALVGEGSTAEVGGRNAGGGAGLSGTWPVGRDDSNGDDAAAATAAPEDGGRSRWRRPLALAGVALGIFLLAMGGITAFEAVAGKPLDAIVGGKHSSGTTVGSLIGGQSTQPASHRATPTPTPTSAPTPGASTSPTPTPTPTTTPTPTPTTTPTPTPTRSPGASTAPTTGASANPATTQ
jgi:cell division septation protein DedD